MSASTDNDTTSLQQLLGAADHIDRLLSAKSAEQAVELAAELLLATSGASGVVVFAKGPRGLEEQWAAGMLAGGEATRRKLAEEVMEKGEVVLRDGNCAVPLAAGRIYAVLVAQEAPEITEDFAALLTSLGSRGLEAAALRVATTKQQQLRLTLNRYLNPSIVRTIVRGDHATTAPPSMRSVSVLTLDFEGFESQVDMIGPDRMLPVTNQFFAAIVDTVYEHEGLLVEHGLSRVMAVFGAPIGLDDTTAADLAVATGFAAIERLEDVTERWGIEGLPIHLETRAGVASGPAVVGAFGPPDRPLFAALGPYVTLAAKLAVQGDEGEVIVDSTTRTLLAERLSTRSIGAVEVRGLDYPIFAYAAQGSR